jgi:hypothetical protein
MAAKFIPQCRGCAILAMNEAKRFFATDSQAKTNVCLPDMEHEKRGWNTVLIRFHPRDRCMKTKLGCALNWLVFQ